MSGRTSGEKKNKYLIPTIIVSVLLVIALSMLLVIILTPDADDSVSKGNAIGTNRTAMVGGGNTLLAARGSGLVRYMPSMTALSTQSQDGKISLAWWTNFDAEKRFTVSNMLPGDSERREYIIKINSQLKQTLTFEQTVDTPSVLSEVLMMKVEVSEGDTGVWTELYDGLLEQMDPVDYDLLNTNESEFKYALTVYLPTSANNRYAGQSLTVDFAWTFTERTVMPPSGGGGGSVNPVTPQPISFDNVKLGGEKTVKGDDPSASETFTFLLEKKNERGIFEPVGEVTSSIGSVDFTDIMSGFVFDKRGVYEFRVTEKAGGTEGMEYDTSEKIFQIYVWDTNNNGVLRIIDVAGVKGITIAHDEATDVYEFSFRFTNNYKNPSGTGDGPDGPDTPGTDPEDEKLEIKIPIENEVKEPEGTDDTDVPDKEGAETSDKEGTEEGDGEGDTPGGSDSDDDGDGESEDKSGFAFAIENVDTGEKQIVLTDESGKAYIELEFDGTDVGETKKYKVYAIPGTEKGVTYSDKVYELEISVKRDASGELYAELTVDGVPTRLEDVKLTFVTYAEKDNEDPVDELDDLIVEITMAAVALLIGYSIFLYMFEGEKYRLLEKKKNVTLNSLAAPILFFGLRVPMWQAILLVILVIAVLAMFTYDVVYYRHLKRKIREELEKEKKEEAEREAEENGKQ